MLNPVNRKKTYLGHIGFASRNRQATTEMTTPHERLARMRKSFAKNKSVLTKDYKYFITPEKADKPRVRQPEHKQILVKCQPTR
jgi:hypothetical protein